MTTSRRDFLTMLTAAGGAFVAPRGMCAAIASERKLRLGVCSDIHVGSSELWKWKKMLAYFRDQKVDAVIVAGDLANCGLVSEMRAVMEAWWKIFPDGKRPDGAPIEHFFVNGNHDVALWNELRKKHALKNTDGSPQKNEKGEIEFDLEALKPESVLLTRDTLWPELFHEPYSHFIVKQVKGFTLLGSHWRSAWPKHEYEAVELPQYLKDHAAELGKTKPFFFVQHCHPRGTCHGQDAWWPDCGKNTTDVLKDFPNAVCFSGHSHKTLTDLKAVWQGAFTSFGTGSLSYCSTLGNDPGIEFINQASAPEGHSWRVGNGDCHMSTIVDVHDGFLAVQPFEVKYLEPLVDQLIVPVPVKPDTEFAFAKRSAKCPPAYAKQPEVTIKDVTCKNWKGEPYPMQQLSFAAVPQGDSRFSRVYAYEITMRPKDGSPTLVKNVVAAAANMPPKMEPDKVCWNVKPGTFKNAADYEFEIVPVDCFRTHAKYANKNVAVLGMRLEKNPKGWSVDTYCQEGLTHRAVVDNLYRTTCKRYDAFILFVDGDKNKKEVAYCKAVIERKQPGVKVILASKPADAVRKLS